MQTNIHLPQVDEGPGYHPAFNDLPAFAADTGHGYISLDVNDGDGGQVVVFISTVEQAQLLVEAAVEIRNAMRVDRAERVKAELSRRTDRIFSEHGA